MAIPNLKQVIRDLTSTWRSPAARSLEIATEIQRGRKEGKAPQEIAKRIIRGRALPAVAAIQEKVSISQRIASMREGSILTGADLVKDHPPGGELQKTSKGYILRVSGHVYRARNLRELEAVLKIQAKQGFLTVAEDAWLKIVQKATAPEKAKAAAKKIAETAKEAAKPKRETVPPEEKIKKAKQYEKELPKEVAEFEKQKKAFEEKTRKYDLERRRYERRAQLFEEKSKDITRANYQQLLKEYEQLEKQRMELERKRQQLLQEQQKLEAKQKQIEHKYSYIRGVAETAPFVAEPPRWGWESPFAVPLSERIRASRREAERYLLARRKAAEAESYVERRVAERYAKKFEKEQGGRELAELIYGSSIESKPYEISPFRAGHYFLAGAPIAVATGGAGALLPLAVGSGVGVFAEHAAYEKTKSPLIAEVAGLASFAGADIAATKILAGPTRYVVGATTRFKGLVGKDIGVVEVSTRGKAVAKNLLFKAEEPLDVSREIIFKKLKGKGVGAGIGVSKKDVANVLKKTVYMDIPGRSAVLRDRELKRLFGAGRVEPAAAFLKGEKVKDIFGETWKKVEIKSAEKARAVDLVEETTKKIRATKGEAASLTKAEAYVKEQLGLVRGKRLAATKLREAVVKGKKVKVLKGEKRVAVAEKFFGIVKKGKGKTYKELVEEFDVLRGKKLKEVESPHIVTRGGKVKRIKLTEAEDIMPKQTRVKQVLKIKEKPKLTEAEVKQVIEASATKEIGKAITKATEKIGQAAKKSIVSAILGRAAAGLAVAPQVREKTTRKPAVRVKSVAKLQISPPKELERQKQNIKNVIKQVHKPLVSTLTKPKTVTTQKIKPLVSARQIYKQITKPKTKQVSGFPFPPMPITLPQMPSSRGFLTSGKPFKHVEKMLAPAKPKKGKPAKKAGLFLPLKSDPLVKVITGFHDLPRKYQKMWEKEFAQKGAFVSLLTFEELLALKKRKKRKRKRR